MGDGLERRRPLGCALLAALALAAACRPSGPAPRRNNLLLITIDTLRADHLGAWGYPRATSPTIDRLAAEGFIFEQAWAQWPKTGPSFASLLSSTYPKDNGLVRRVGVPLPFGMRLVAEVLHGAGYATHAVVANGALASELGFAQGFDDFVEAWKLPGYRGPEASCRAGVVTREALRLAQRIDRERPFFLWVHYLDPHFPYAPPGAWQDRFQGDSWYDPTRRVAVGPEARREIGGIGTRQALEGGRREHAFYVARYDAEIAYTDAMLGELLTALERRGLMDGTLLALTADHGESLGEHRYYFHHGRFGFETCLHVPLLLHRPGRIRPGRDAAPAELIDLAPTLLELAGVPLEHGGWMQGHSLVARLGGSERPGGNARAEVGYARAEAGYATEGRWQKVIRDRRYKLIFAPYIAERRHIGGADQPYALFDLAADPGETENLVAARPQEFRRLKDALFAWWQPNSFPVLVDGEGGTAPGMTDATREHLEALGYLDN